MKILTSNVRLGNSIFKMRRNYSRMVVSISNFNKVHDQRSAAHCMTEANRIHRLLSSYESTYYANIRSDAKRLNNQQVQAQIEKQVARCASAGDRVLRLAV